SVGCAACTARAAAVTPPCSTQATKYLRSRSSIAPELRRGRQGGDLRRGEGPVVEPQLVDLAVQERIVAVLRAPQPALAGGAQIGGTESHDRGAGRLAVDVQRGGGRDVGGQRDRQVVPGAAAERRAAVQA